MLKKKFPISDWDTRRFANRHDFRLLLFTHQHYVGSRMCPLIEAELAAGASVKCMLTSAGFFHCESCVQIFFQCARCTCTLLSHGLPLNTRTQLGHSLLQHCIARKRPDVAIRLKPIHAIGLCSDATSYLSLLSRDFFVNFLDQ
jgi:hypothetical protein